VQQVRTTLTLLRSHPMRMSDMKRQVYWDSCMKNRSVLMHVLSIAQCWLPVSVTGLLNSNCQITITIFAPICFACHCKFGR